MSTVTAEPFRIMLVAGEISGDRLGAQLMAALRRLSPRPVEFLGVGGAAMAEQGLTSLHDIGDTAVVGVWDVLKRLPLLLRRIRATAKFALDAAPDMLLLVDSPDFTHRVARLVRAGNRRIPIVACVAPSIWAWRRRRARTMRRHIDHVLVLLPFEEEVFRRAGGPACTYVGHPALEEIPTPQEGEAFRRRHGIHGRETLVALLPGSRRGEVLRHADRFVAIGRRLAEMHAGVRLVVLGRGELRAMLMHLHENWGEDVLLVFGEDERRGLFAAADGALAAVGTAVLELGLARVPMVVGLREHAFNAWLAARILRVPSLSLVNLVLDAPAIAECLQDELQPDKTALALRNILVSPGRERTLESLDAFRAAMNADGMNADGESPSMRAARVVLRLLPLKSGSGGRAESALGGGGLRQSREGGKAPR